LLSVTKYLRKNYIPYIETLCKSNIVVRDIKQQRSDVRRTLLTMCNGEVGNFVMVKIIDLCCFISLTTKKKKKQRKSAVFMMQNFIALLKEAPIQKSAPCGPNAASNGCIVQCLCLSLVFVLHLLMLTLNLTLFLPRDAL